VVRFRRGEATQVLGNTTKWLKAAAANQNTHTVMVRITDTLGKSDQRRL